MRTDLVSVSLPKTLVLLLLVIYVRLRSSSNDIEFTDAVLKADAISDCGTGIFDVNSAYLYQPRNCPQIIMTENKQPMNTVSFKWTAPNCGCVTFRATVIRNGETYYYDDDKVTDGKLVRTVCPHGERHVEKLRIEVNTTPSTSLLSYPQLSKLNRADRLNLLCKITQTFTINEILQRPMFLERRALQNTTLVELFNIELALEQRRADVVKCCKESVSEKATCFSDVRRHRIDQFCGDGYPSIPFTTSKDNYMRKREAECCWKLGESRYRCFNKSDDVETPLRTKYYSMDFSLDESDPINDIADYPTEINSIEEKNKTILFDVDDSHNTAIKTSNHPTTLSAFTTGPQTLQASRIPLLRKASRPPQTTYLPISAEIKPRQGDMAPAYLPRQSNTKKTPIKSSVEITVQTLAQKLWKSSLRLACCQQGQIYAEKSHQQDFWKGCRLAAKDFREIVRRGKRICANSFQKCCFEQHLTVTQKEERVSTTQELIAHMSLRHTTADHRGISNDDLSVRSAAKDNTMALNSGIVYGNSNEDVVDEDEEDGSDDADNEEGGDDDTGEPYALSEEQLDYPKEDTLYNPIFLPRKVPHEIKNRRRPFARSDTPESRLVIPSSSRRRPENVKQSFTPENSAKISKERKQRRRQKRRRRDRN
ncbi:uncharacterized protein LOC126811299 [Patella vulgata]|uniref:uncharacterized protein LOC126811299 n=1 Tax=Patella vulgata TaxID=6465 RepID=UPI0024A938DE|nr:uncharacterized protein LOC126811299 [Patella vulgata]